MPRWIALPIYSLCFAAPVALAVLLVRPLWQGPHTPVSEVAEAVAIGSFIVGASLVAGMLALNHTNRPDQRR